MFILKTHKTEMSIFSPTAYREETGSYMFIGAHWYEYPCHDSKT